MNISMICTGKTTEKYVAEGMRTYAGRLGHYCRFQVIEMEQGKGDAVKIRKQESEMILKKIGKGDLLVLLDEQGKEYSSPQFADWIRHHQNISTKNLVFLIGGAYGFSEEVYERADGLIALSKMTFPHQLVRVLFLEQLYRAFSILKGEKYHH